MGKERELTGLYFKFGFVELFDGWKMQFFRWRATTWGRPYKSL